MIGNFIIFFSSLLDSFLHTTSGYRPNKTGEGTYNTTCATCHAVGVAGAPKLGDIAAWEPRLAQGMDVLYDHGINGLAPAMPAKGMCFTCSDDDIKALVDYMVDSVK